MDRIIPTAMVNRARHRTSWAILLGRYKNFRLRLTQQVRSNWHFSLVLAALPVGVAHAAQWDINYGLGFNQVISDNIDLDPDGEEETGLISDVVGNFSVQRTSARLRANYSGNVTLRYQTGGDDEGLELLPNVRGLGNIEAIEDLFFIDTANSVSQQTLDSRSGDTESSRETVQTHSISPYLVNRFGGFASAELRYRFNHVRTDDSSSRAPGDNRISERTTTQTVSSSLTSGIDFSRLQWSINALASETDRSDDNDIERRLVTLNTEYAVDRQFSLIGSIGYESFDEDEERGVDVVLSSAEEFSGLTWRTGFRWRPSRRMDLEATYGRRDDDDSLDAKLGYDIGPRTRLTASYAERLETGEERLERNLSTIGEDPVTGELIDTSTGLPFDDSTGSTSVVSDVTRTKTFRADLSGTRGRNTFRVGSFYSEQKDVNTSIFAADDETATGINGSWSRRLNPRTNFNLRGSFVNTEFENENREDQEYSLSTGVDHNLFSNVNAFANYRYRQKVSDLEADEYTENRIVFGARASF